MLAHTAYLETLRTLRESTAEWKETLAGLLVMRLVDAWLGDQAGLVTQDVHGLQAVQETLSNVPERSHVWVSLSRILRVIEQTEHPHPRPLIPHLLSYGQTLQLNGHWTLSEDVYTSILQHGQAIRDRTTTTSAARKLAFVLRNQSKLTAAEEAATLAVREAYWANDIDSYLQARLGVARIRASRGQITHAHRLLDDINTEAERYDLMEIAGGVFLDRAWLYAISNDYKTAGPLCTRALALLTDPILRSRARCDLGTALAETGHWRAAEHLFLGTYRDAPEKVVQQTALINLLAVSVFGKDKSMFEEYRRELTNTALPPYMLASYHLVVGQGYQIWGQRNMAIEETHCAIEIAATHSLAWIQSRGGAQLKSIDATH